MQRSRLVLFALLFLAACAPNRGTAYDKALAEAKRANNAGRFDIAADRFDEAARTAKVKRDAAFMKYEAALARARAGDVARASQELRALANETPPSAYAAQAAYKAAELSFKSDPAAGMAEFEAMAFKFPDSGVARVALLRVVREDPSKLEGFIAKGKGTVLEEHLLYERAKGLAEKEPAAARDLFVEIANRWPYPHGVYFDDALFHASEAEEKLNQPQKAIEHLERLLAMRELSVTLGTYERPK